MIRNLTRCALLLAVLPSIAWYCDGDGPPTIPTGTGENPITFECVHTRQEVIDIAEANCDTCALGTNNLRATGCERPCLKAYTVFSGTPTAHHAGANVCPLWADKTCGTCTDSQTCTNTPDGGTHCGECQCCAGIGANLTACCALHPGSPHCQ